MHILKPRGMSLLIKQLLGGFKREGRKGGEPAEDGSIWLIGYQSGETSLSDENQSLAHCLDQQAHGHQNLMPYLN